MRIRNIRTIGITILLIPVCIAAYFLVRFIVLSALGYYIEKGGAEVAQIIVAHHGKPTECMKIVYGTPFFNYPSLSEIRGGCIYEFASLAKDPAACELLMPSDYGLSCITQSISPLFKDDGDAENVTSDDNCDAIVNHQLKQDNCWDMKAHRFHDIAICKKIQNSVIRTSCELKIGAWDKYPELRSSFYFGKYRQT